MRMTIRDPIPVRSFLRCRPRRRRHHIAPARVAARTSSHDVLFTRASAKGLSLLEKKFDLSPDLPTTRARAHIARNSWYINKSERARKHKSNWKESFSDVERERERERERGSSSLRIWCAGDT